MKKIIFYVFTSFLISVTLPAISTAAGHTSFRPDNAHEIVFQPSTLQAQLPWQTPQRLIVNDVCWDCV